MKSKDIVNKVNEVIDPMDMIRGRLGPEMGGGGRTSGYIGGSGGRAPSMTPQSARELAPQILKTPTQVKPSKAQQEPVIKRVDTPPELVRPSPEVSRVPAVQRKAQADKKTSPDKEPVKKTDYKLDTDYPIIGQTKTQPRQLTPQEKAEQLLKGQGFKQEPGSVSGGFKPRKSEPKKAEKDKAEPAKAEPTPQEPSAPTQRTTLSGDPIPAGYKWNPKTGKYDPPPEPSALKDLAAVPGGIKSALTPQDKKALATSVGGHAALLALLAGIQPDEKKSGAEKSQFAQRGDSDKPMTVNLIDPGSLMATDAAAATTPDNKAMTATMSNDSQVDSDKSLPPVVVTAKPEPVKPEKKQPVEKEAAKKAEEPKKDSAVMTTNEPSSWEVEDDDEEEEAEADKVDDKETKQTTQAVPEPEPEEDEDDLLKRLLKNLFTTPEPSKEPETSKEPDPEPAREPEAKKAEPKPEPEKKSQDGEGRADSDKGDLINYGDERIAYPKFDKGDRNELPRDTEKTGPDTRTRKTDSDVDRGPAARGSDDTTNFAPPPPERKYEPDDRATRLRDRLQDRMNRDRDPNFQDRRRMAPVNESLNRIINLAQTTKKEIVESTTMNLDMRQMIALLDEATKMADIKGKKHTGKYGKEYDTDEEGDAKDKKAEPAEKKKRGRQETEATKDAKKWQGADAAGAAIIGGKAPSSAAKGTKHGFTAAEKAAKKAEKAKAKKNLKDWFESTAEALQEGAKVDRMVKHIAKSERDLGKSKKEAENIGWATANKRGYLDNKNKKKVKEENYTVNKKPVSKSEYDANMKAAGKSASPANVKEALKGGQKNLDVAEPKGKLDAKDFAKLRAKKKVSEAEKAKKDYDGDGKIESGKDEYQGSRIAAAKKAGKLKEGVNFAEMMKETQMSIEEMLEGLQQEIAEFKATGHMGDNLRDALEIHRYKGKDKLMGESPMMSQTVVEEPLEENPFTYAARQAKASGEDSFKLGGETFPVKESEEVDEAMSRHAKGYEKFGPEGMRTLALLGKKGASEKKMDAARKKFNKYDNDKKVDEDGPGASRLYGDNEPQSDSGVLNTLKKFANKGIDAYNDYEQSKKDAWDSRKWSDGSGGKPGSSGYNPAKIPKFDTDEPKIEKIKNLSPMSKEPPESITDREKPYRDPKTGKMVTPPKGLSISEPVYPNAVDINKPSKGKESMKENLDFSLWDNQLEKMINESLTVTTTQGDNDTENSVSITASGEHAGEIMALLKNAGIDSVGSSPESSVMAVEPEQMLSAYGAPISGDSEGSGSDDILSLMKKLTGLNIEDADHANSMEVEPEHDEHNSSDYEEEEQDENEEKDEAEEGSDDEDHEEEKVNEEREISTSVDDEGRIHYMRDPKNPSPQKSSVDDRGRLQFKDTDRPNSSSVDDQDRIHYMRDPKNPSPQRSSVDDKGRLQFKDTDRPQQSSVDDKGRLQFKGDTAGPQRSSVDDKGRLQYKGPSAGAQQSSVDDQGRLRFVKEYDEEMTNEGMCQECGMYEGECGHGMNEAEGTYADPKGHIYSSNGKTEYVPAPGYRVRTTFTPGKDDPTTTFVKADSNDKGTQKDQKNENLESARPIEEELANGADNTSMQDIKYLIKTLAGGLNKEKRDQTTLPYTAVKMTESEEMLNQWKKLSGIK